MSDLVRLGELPQPFGLGNSGAICYANALLQALASCTSVTEVLAGVGEVTNPVLRALRIFAERVRSNSVGGHESQLVVSALVTVVQNRPGLRRYFGHGQQSASEALLLLLEAAACPALERLFIHRRAYATSCDACGHTVRSAETDVQFLLFDPADARPFDERLLSQPAAVEYRCENVRSPGGGGGDAGARCAGTRARRTAHLTMVPEVLVVIFNAYDYGGVPRAAHPFPAALTLGPHAYRQVAQVEHAGGLSGGHYWARALRQGGQVVCANDASVQPGAFGPSPETYMVFYHYCK